MNLESELKLVKEKFQSTLEENELLKLKLINQNIFDVDNIVEVENGTLLEYFSLI